MLTSSAKSKGRRLQQYVRDKLLSIFTELTNRDITSTPMGVAGEDIWLSERANTLFPFSIECKNQEGLNIWAALEKTEQDNRREHGILVFKRNNSKVYCAMDFNIFLELIQKLGGGKSAS